MARRRRVRPGQPEVQRHHAGLDPKADQRDQKNRGLKANPDLRSIEPPQFERPGRDAEHREEREQRERADVRRNQVNPPGSASLGLVVFSADQEERRERHDLPSEEEGDSISRQRHQCQTRDEQAIAEAELSPIACVLALLPVFQPVNRPGHTEQEHGHHEERRKRIKPEMKRPFRQRPGKGE
jgi:hypothetical protein